MKDQLRELLKVPKEFSIAEWIYERWRNVDDDYNNFERYFTKLEDDEFIKLMENK